MGYVLIADAGSTKTDWSLIEPGRGNVVRIKGTGINPIQQTEKEILDAVEPIKSLLDIDLVSSVYFYGAGCLGERQIEKIGFILNSIFKGAKIHIDSDIKAACIALFANKSGIVSILGTGSNTCLYKEGIIESKIPSLGFILGDEGSGVALGKLLLNSVFKRQLDSDLISKFNNKYQLKLEILLENIYQSRQAGAYMASFVPFLSENIENCEIKELIENAFDEFFKKNILPYNSDLKLGFVGSIAYIFQNSLRKTAEKYQLEISDIFKTPMPNLEQYYIHKI